MKEISLAGMPHDSSKQLVNINFCNWACQHTVPWVFACRRSPPMDERYWEYGVESDDVCHRVKHLGKNKIKCKYNAGEDTC